MNICVHQIGQLPIFYFYEYCYLTISEIDTLIFILQMRKIKAQKSNYLTQGQIAGKSWSIVFLAPKPLL